MSSYCLEGRNGNQAVGQGSIRDVDHLAALFSCLLPKLLSILLLLLNPF